MKISKVLMSVGVAFALGVSASAQAQRSLKVATGSATGTYATMFKQLQNMCANTITMAEQPSSGSVENVQSLAGNMVNAGIVQSDVLYYFSQSQDLGSVKTLFALHPEEVHILTKNMVRKTGGVGVGAIKINRTEFVITSLDQLAGMKIGAAGGSVITANVIRLQSQLPFDVVELGDTDKVMKALDEDQIDAALFVGGQPLPFMAKLGKQYRLVGIPDAIRERLKGVYNVASVNYINFGDGGRAIATVSTNALFVTREYKTPAMVEGLSKLRSCMLTNLDELKETTGNHPKWQAVKAEDHGKWPWYELPSVKK